MVHENIKVFRASMRLNQEEFGIRIGVSKDTICNWERAKTNPDIVHILTMIKMGANIDYLLFGKGSPRERITL